MSARSSSSGRHHWRTKRSRVVLAAALGAVAGGIALFWLPWWLALLVAWDVLALSLALMWWRALSGHDAEATADLAQRDDMAHSLWDAFLVLTSVASLGGVLALQVTHQTSYPPWLVASLSVSTVVVSWCLVHLLYALRYAVAYYHDGGAGGVKFDDEDSRPMFSDFIYLAYTIGMTYQVSDSELTTSGFRRLVVVHAMLSYVFGTAIIATTINLLAGLSSGR